MSRFLLAAHNFVICPKEVVRICHAESFLMDRSNLNGWWFRRFWPILSAKGVPPLRTQAALVIGQFISSSMSARRLPLTRRMPGDDRLHACRLVTRWAVRAMRANTWRRWRGDVDVEVGSKNKENGDEGCSEYSGDSWEAISYLNIIEPYLLYIFVQ